MGAATIATALLSILILATPVTMVHAADEPASGAAVVPKAASNAVPTKVEPKSKGGKVKPFLGGTSDGTGIRRSAPVGPNVAAAAADAVDQNGPQSATLGAHKPGDGSVKPFLGGSQEGTGIRQSAPVGPKAAAAAKKNGR